MAAENFPRALTAWTWRPGNEGPDDGGSVTAGDQGGFTRLGVTLTTFRAWREAHGSPHGGSLDLRQAPLEELSQIYHQWFWAAVQGDLLPAGLDLVTFDFGITSGPGRALKFLQAAVGTSPDGLWGPKTKAAVADAKAAETVDKLTVRIRNFDRQLLDFGLFGRGWETRREGCRQMAQRWIYGANDPVESDHTIGNT